MNIPARATAALLAGAVSLLMAWPAAAQTVVRVSSLPIVDTTPMQAAIAQGYFKEEGLEVTAQPSQQGGAAGIPGMAAGSFDFVYTNTTSFLLAAHQGLDVRMIAGASHNPPQPPHQVALVARKDDNLKNGKDFEGKSIAINARNNVQWLFVRGWVKATGGDPDKVNYREVPFPAMIDAVRNKQVDGALAIDPFLAASRNDASIAIVDWPFHVVAPGIQMAGYVTMGETVAKKPEMVQKFVRAIGKGTEWVKTNKDSEAYLQLVNSFTRMDPKTIRQMGPFVPSAAVDLASLKKMESLMKDHGLVKSELDLQSKVVK